MPSGHDEWRQLRSECCDEEDDDDDDDNLFITAMVEGVRLSDRFLAKEFRRSVNNHAVNFILENPYPSWFYATGHAFRNLTYDNALLRCLIDVSCEFCEADNYLRLEGESDDECLLQLPARLLLQILARHVEKAMEGSNW